tara:strand:+ start:32 stop:298 length:267 start_codon:yes stop_codon:yes gene_type:complete
MCIFGRSAPTPISTPAPIQPRQPNLVAESRLPSKKELLDPDDTAGVEYGTSAKKGSPAAGSRTGTDALKININTGAGGGGGSTGGLNV